MKQLLVAGVVAAAFCGVPALAADVALKAPPIGPVPYGWTSCAGGNIGAGWS